MAATSFFCRRAAPLSAEKNDAAIVASPGAMPSLGGVQRLGHDCVMNSSLAAGGGAEKHWSKDWVPLPGYLSLSHYLSIPLPLS
jgi:hypothetical protein